MPKSDNLNTVEKNDIFNKLRISRTHYPNAIESLTLSFGKTKNL